MKTIIRRFSRVTDSTRYLRFVSTHNGTDSSAMKKERKDVPYGYLPVYVGDEMERFVVNTQCLNHPIFMLLLNRSKQVYGYSQPGALHIPCKVSVFERVLEVIENGSRVVNLDEIVQSFSEQIL